MKRPSEDDPRRAEPADEKLDAFFSGFLSRHPRLPLLIGVTLVVLVFIAILVAKFAGRGH